MLKITSCVNQSFRIRNQTHDNSNYLVALGLVRLKANLQHPIAERVPVERLNGDHGLLVVSHGHKSEALAFVGLQITNHLNAQTNLSFS